MKIIATIFILPLAFLIVQPLLSVSKVDTKMHCAKMKCHKQKQDKNRDCNTNKDCNNCNPFMACSIGNFFINEKQVLEFRILESPMQQIPNLNDNRLASCLSDCWHPPESA